MSIDTNTLRAVYECLSNIDCSFITKLLIYKEMCAYLNDSELEDALEIVYDAYIKNDIWIDLATFAMNVAQQWHEHDDKRMLVDLAISQQGEMQ